MSPQTTPHPALRAAILKALYLTTAAGAAAGVAVHTVFAPGAMRPGLALGNGVLVLLALFAALSPPHRAQQMMPLVMLVGVFQVGAAAIGTGAGLQAPGLALLPLVLCLVGAIGTRGQSAAVIAGAALAAIAVGWAEATGVTAVEQGAAQAPVGVRTALQLLSIALGAAGGLTLEALMRRHVGAVVERERRFSTLLGIAAAAYWETDAQLRVGNVLRRDDSGAFVPLQAIPARPPWEIPGLTFEPEARASLIAAMSARTAFRDIAVRWQPPGHDATHLLVSGEPRRDEHGEFAGYWAVARDVTAEHAALAASSSAEQALRRSQALLSKLVSTSPDVITLTDLRSGRYEMVNESFTRITGVKAEDAIGRTSTELGIWNDPAERQQLTEAVIARGAVRDVSVEFRRTDGGVVRMQVSATRFEREGEDYLVINARDISAAERTRLEHLALLDSAQIGIAFTRERHFLMANPHFEQIFRWPHGALVGMPGRVVWTSDEDYAALGQLIGPALARGEQIDIERPAMRGDGTTFLVRMRAKAVDPDNPADSGTVWIAEDVTEQRQAQAALGRARDEAEAANRAKSAFLANMSHEIRTPLNGLVGLARLARQPGVEPVRLRQYLEQIASSAETLSAIISDILDLSKIEAGRLEIESAPFNLLGLLQSMEQAYLALATNNGLAFEVQIDPRLPAWVRGDALRVRQILANFLHNALKFTPRGSVRLVARLLDDERIRFEVHDTGVGIDEATRARLFRPFTQADESITRRFGGTGLGLSICRELAELMGGCVGVVSTPGQGSCFFTELALPHDIGEPEPSGYGPLESDPLNGAQVLLVEDNAVNMMIGVALLEQWGISVTQAADGPRALAAVAEADRLGRPFDLVLMDLQMPGMSGYEATRALREHHSMQRLPIIALTAAALTSEREHAAEIGMNDFLTKPIDPNRLRQTLQRVLAAADAARAGGPGLNRA